MADRKKGDGKLSISYLPSSISCPDPVGALADGVKEIKASPEFSVRLRQEKKIAFSDE